MAGAPVVSPALAASAPGIGDLCFLCPEWVAAARGVMEELVAKHSAALKEAGRFTVCEVGHNPPWHSSPYGESYKSETKPYLGPKNGPGRVVYGNKLAWWLRIQGSAFEVGEGELPATECDMKVEGDHSIMSRLARVLSKGVDPRIIAAAKAQLVPQSKWVVKGKVTEEPVLTALLSELHDAMAVRTIPRMVWMSSDWVDIARQIITTRATNPKFRDNEKTSPMLKDTDFIFAEEFANPPRYVNPDGSSGGFWAVCRHGHVTVGYGSLPAEYGEPDVLTKGQYIPIIAGGRTVNAALNKEEMKMAAERGQNMPKTFNGKPTMSAMQKVKKGGKPMPACLGICFMPMHDELSLRSSGEVASDFDPSIDDGGAPPFDRSPEYKETWLRYDKVDVNGQTLAWSKL